MLATVVNIFLL